MNGTLDDLYLTWLYEQVGDVKVRNKSRTHWDLIRQMYKTEFAWTVPNDDNRVEDGRELRYEWASENDIPIDHAWAELPCSFLEMLIGLCRRLSFEAEGHPPVWFWHILENLGLQHCHDRPKYDQRKAQERLDTVINRTYEPSGLGGLFPLRYAHEDQRRVEIWYQMSAYLLEG